MHSGRTSAHICACPVLRNLCACVPQGTQANLETVKRVSNVDVGNSFLHFSPPISLSPSVPLLLVNDILPSILIQWPSRPPQIPPHTIPLGHLPSPSYRQYKSQLTTVALFFYIFVLFVPATKSPRPPPVCWLGLCGKGTCVNIKNNATCL